MRMLDFHPEANRYPLLEGDAYEAFKADIDKRGLQLPIVLDRKTNTILDGRNRYRACRELGIDCVTGADWYDGDNQRGYVRSLNLHRRHIGPIAWANDFKEECEEREVRLGKQGRQKTETVSDLAKEFGVTERTARNRLALAEELADTPDLAAKVDNHEITAKEAIQIVRNHARTAEREKVAVLGVEATPNPEARVITGDFRDADSMQHIESGSVSLVFTDPPYDEKSLPLYADLGQFAARVLKPGGSLITYTPHYAIRQVITDLETAGLRYWWMLAKQHGSAARLPGKWVYVEWKPLVWMVQGGRCNRDYVSDTIRTATTADKSLQDWSQHIEDAKQLINVLTEPGELVADPMCGAGTTLKAALECGRRSIGFEIDGQRADVARGRLVT